MLRLHPVLRKFFFLADTGGASWMWMAQQTRVPPARPQAATFCALAFFSLPLLPAEELLWWLPARQGC